VKGFYRGYWAALATYAPFVSIYFATYEHFKKSFSNPDAVVAQVICGSSAAVLASGITNPLDVIKTRVQVDSQPALFVFRKLMREEGVRALAKGTEQKQEQRFLILQHKLRCFCPHELDCSFVCNWNCVL
jgi:hypothetical protein